MADSSFEPATDSNRADSDLNRPLLRLELAVVVVLTVLPSFFGAATMWAWPGQIVGPKDPYHGYWVLATLLRAVTWAAPCLYFIESGPSSRAAHGLVRPRLFDLGIGVGVTVAMLFNVSLAQRLFGLALPAPFWTPRSAGDYVLLVGMAVATALAAEVTFRAYMLPRLIALGAPTPVAVAAQAAMFGVTFLYAGATDVAIAVVLGLILGVSFLASRRALPGAIALAAYCLLRTLS